MPVSAEECNNASLILERTFDSVSALLKAFDAGTSPGRPTDEQQDLLRAMLVMAAAGVDAMAKQLIRDSLPTLVRNYPNVAAGLETFIARQIRDDSDLLESGGARNFLARILAAPSHQTQVIEEYIKTLTAGSLQSATELFHIAEALGLSGSSLGMDKSALQAIFNLRNKIIHELDIVGFGQQGRLRNIRNRTDMVKHTNTLLRTAEALRDAVDQKLISSG